jgi:hypothetical protein
MINGYNQVSVSNIENFNIMVIVDDEYGISRMIDNFYL